MIRNDCPLLLGSASPRRREMLATARVPVRVVVADVDERVVGSERPDAYLNRVVSAKLHAVAGLMSAPPVAALLVADTTVVVDDEILGKPATITEARDMVSRLVGRWHSVLTRYAIASAARPWVAMTARTVETRVFMRAASAAEVARYAATGEGLDKAGAYAVQGIGAFLVERIEGSYPNVVGLPVCEVLVDLQRHGLLEALP